MDNTETVSYIRFNYIDHPHLHHHLVAAGRGYHRWPLPGAGRIGGIWKGVQDVWACMYECAQEYIIAHQTAKNTMWKVRSIPLSKLAHDNVSGVNTQLLVHEPKSVSLPVSYLSVSVHGTKRHQLTWASYHVCFTSITCTNIQKMSGNCHFPQCLCPIHWVW